MKINLTLMFLVSLVWFSPGYSQSTVSGWDIYDNTLPGTVDAVNDDGAAVFKLDNGGQGINTGYRYTFPSPVSGKRYISWQMKYAEDFQIYISCNTSVGHRYIYYTVASYDDLGTGGSIHYGLDATAKSGTWVTVERDLQRDLSNAQAGVTLLSVDSLLIRGSGYMDNIKLNSGTSNAAPEVSPITVTDGVTPDVKTFSVTATDADSLSLRYLWSLGSGPGTVSFAPADGALTNATFSKRGSYTVKLEVTDGVNAVSATVDVAIEVGLEGWSIYDKSPMGTISAVDDNGKAAVKLDNGGQGRGTGYRYTFPSPVSGKPYVAWQMKYSEDFTIYLSCNTTVGHRFIYYTVSGSDDLGSREYIHYGLDATVKAGSWVTIERDLQRDLSNAQPGVMLLSVDAFLIRGSGLVDDITLSATTSNAPPVLSEIGVTSGPTLDVKTLSVIAEDTDSNALRYTWKLVSGPGSATYDPVDWSTTNATFGKKGDYTIQLDVTDGINVVSGTVNLTIEGGLAGWDIYDNSPGGTISVVDDNGKAAVKLDNGGQGMGTGYRYTFPSPVAGKRYMSWQMKYSEDFTIFVSCNTSAGHRYITYTVSESDSLGSNSYIRYGLDAAVKAGSWVTVERDLQRDLSNAQPGVTLDSVNAFLIRGSGLVDNISLSDTTQNTPPKLSRIAVVPGASLDIKNLSVVAADIDSYSLRYNWSLVSGPGPVSFEPNNATATNAKFGTKGYYTVKLDVTDGISTVSETVNIIIGDGLEGWDIYDKSPGGNISVANDNGDAVIRLDNGGQGLGTGYRYTFPSPVGNKPYVSWQMKYSEDFTVFLSCNTSVGHRYITYSVSDSDALGGGEYIRYGLDAAVKTGSWVTIERDLQRDLDYAQPGVLLLTVDKFLIRGSGLVDDIMLSDTTNNIAPLVTAIAVNPGPTFDVKTLSAGAVDIDSYSLRYKWSMESGPGPIVFDNDTALTATALFMETGDYTVRLEVTDGISVVSTTADVTIATVSAVSPVALAPEKPVIESLWTDASLIQRPNTANLHALASDPAGGLLTYSWSVDNGPGAVEFSSNNTTSSKDTTVTFIAAGTYTLSVTVSSEGGHVATSSIDIVVK